MSDEEGGSPHTPAMPGSSLVSMPSTPAITRFAQLDDAHLDEMGELMGRYERIERRVGFGIFVPYLSALIASYAGLMAHPSPAAALLLVVLLGVARPRVFRWAVARDLAGLGVDRRLTIAMLKRVASVELRRPLITQPRDRAKFLRDARALLAATEA